MLDVTIVGGGPVGLVLALALHARGVRSTVLERRAGPRGGSRSIGIHPPSLELFDELGIGDRFVARGVRVSAGIAFASGRRLGSVDFRSCSGKHRYVLSLEQGETERLLISALEARAPGTLEAGNEVLDVRAGPSRVRVRLRGPRGRERSLESAFVVVCDGRRSLCRDALGIAFRGASYPGAYLMGDTPDATGYGDRACVFLGEDGLVESFPLPGGRRRWVVRRDAEGPPAKGELARTILARTGNSVSDIDALSAFRAERFLAARLAVGRVALAGDAAHVVSPIGGQGMNLGWLGARSLAVALAKAVQCGATSELLADAAVRRRMACAAARRAELNMWLGRPAAGRSREGLVRALLVPPIASGLARLFTMRGLAWGL